MNKEELKQHLQSLKKSLSERDFFSVVLDMLDKNPSQELRNLLEAWLMAYAFCDWDRAARYWQPLLKDESAFQRERGLLHLAVLARKDRSVLAYGIFAELLGHEPSEDEIRNFMKGQGPSSDFTSQE